MSRLTRLVGLLPIIVLAGCRTPGGAVKQTITVQFVTYDSAAAKPVVIDTCGHLPGETVPPARSGDPNVVLDVSHATAVQQSAITTCLDQLQTARPDLKIRTVLYDNGEDN